MAYGVGWFLLIAGIVAFGRDILSFDMTPPEIKKRREAKQRAQHAHHS